MERSSGYYGLCGDAQRGDCLGVNRPDGVWEAFQPVDTGDKEVLHITILEFGDHLEPEFGAPRLGEPQAAHQRQVRFRRHLHQVIDVGSRQVEQFRMARHGQIA